MFSRSSSQDVKSRAKAGAARVQSRAYQAKAGAVRAQGRARQATSQASTQVAPLAKSAQEKAGRGLLGVPVTLTPSSPLSTILQVLNSVTPLVPLKLTNVTTNQPYISSDSLQIPGLAIGT